MILTLFSLLTPYLTQDLPRGPGHRYDMDRCWRPFTLVVHSGTNNVKISVPFVELYLFTEQIVVTRLNHGLSWFYVHVTETKIGGTGKLFQGTLRKYLTFHGIFILHNVLVWGNWNEDRLRFDPFQSLYNLTRVRTEQ